MRPEPVGGGEVKLEIRFSTIRLMRDKNTQCSYWDEGKTHVSSILQASHNFRRKFIGRNARV